MNEHHEFRPAQRPDKRSDRPEGRFEARTDGKPERPRRSLRETVCDIDRDILRMLMRRHNLIKRMYNAKGFLEPAEEKSIRFPRQPRPAPERPFLHPDAGGGIPAPPR